MGRTQRKTINTWVLSIRMIGFFNFGGKETNSDLSVDEIENEIEKYEKKKSNYEHGVEQLAKCVKRMEAIDPSEWLRYRDRDKIAEMKKRDNTMLFIGGEFTRRYRTPKAVQKAINRAFNEFDPSSSEREDEAEIRAERVKQAMLEMANKVENEYLPDIESTLKDLKRMKHEKKADKEFETGVVEDPSGDMEEDLIELIPESEYDQDLAEIEVEKEMDKKAENIKSLMSLEEIAYFIAEDTRSELGRGEYDIDFVLSMEEMYPKHTEEIRDNMRFSDSEEDLKSQLENLHKQSEHIGPLKGAHILYVVGRVYEGNNKKKVDELRTFT